MGSAELSCVSLDAVCGVSWAELAGVICQPDRPQGRRLKPKPCPVKDRAAGRGVPILTPENVNADDSLDAIASLRPDIIVVVAYGQILRRPILDAAPRGCINVHTSLLPAYRGAAPIQWAIANGEQQTGVTTMQINEAMDEGDILLQDALPIGPDETAGELHDRLAHAGAALLVRTLEGVRDQSIVPQSQDHERATYAPKLSKKDGRIDWSLSAAVLRNRIRAFNPWPACFCDLPEPPGARLRVLAAQVVAGVPSADPGAVLEPAEEGPVVQCADGALCLTLVQPQGGRQMSGSAYLRGHPLPTGTRLT